MLKSRGKIESYIIVPPGEYGIMHQCDLCNKPVNILKESWVVWEEDVRHESGLLPSFCLKCGIEKIENNLPAQVRVWCQGARRTVKHPVELLVMLV